MNNKFLARRSLTILALILGLIILFSQADRFVNINLLAFDDYVEYWTASRLNMQGDNPYDPGQMELAQRQLGRNIHIPLMMWNPPWIFGLIMPMALLPYAFSRLLWFILNVAILLGCLSWLWQAFGGSRRLQWIAWLVGFSFSPVIHVLKLGQVGPLMLLGIVGFLIFERQRKDWLAGALLALTLIKPQVPYLFFLAAVVWALANRRWRVIIGIAAAMAISTGIGLSTNPNLLAQYLYAALNYPPAEFATASLGFALRMLFGDQHFWLQFLPVGIGLTWLAATWIRKRRDWDWIQQTPWLTLVSITTAAYVWTFDQTVFLPALAAAAARLCQARIKRRVMIIWILLYLLFGVIPTFLTLPEHWYWWTPGCFLLGYFVLDRQIRKGYPVSTGG